MPRPPRAASGDAVYHVLNRSNGRAAIFADRGDYAAFESLLVQALTYQPMRVLAYCLMPNHWHLVLWPTGDGDLSRFVGWLAMTHAQRRHTRRGTVGTGHLYQGRFRSFPVQTDSHYLNVVRYVERNPLRAGLVRRAEDWPWGSLYHRVHHPTAGGFPTLSSGPVDLPPDWPAVVNEPQTDAELTVLRTCVHRGRPYGEPVWVDRTAKMFGLESCLRPRGRPRKRGQEPFLGP